MNNSKAWNCYADEFNEYSIFDKTNIHTGLGLPGINPSEIVKSASRILDVGCGNGINTFLMHMVNKGVTVGIDSAQTFINQALHDYSEHGCTFYHMDFGHFCTCESTSSFDLVTFFGSLDYFELNHSFMKLLNQITTNSSRCYIAKFHPMWTSLFDNDVALQNTKNYFENGRIDLIKYGRNPVCVLQRYHYSISYIINYFAKYSWHLIRLEEPIPDLKHSAFEYRNYDMDEILINRLSEIPMTILFEFERIR